MKYTAFFVYAFSILCNYTAHNCNILVLSGSGSYGAFEAGVVFNIHDNNQKIYDVYTGVSSGAINTVYLSTTPDINKEDARDLWNNMTTSKVYRLNLLYNYLSIYDTKPLYKTLTNLFSSKTNIYKPFIISATSLTDSKAKLFDETNYDTKNIVHQLMSSTAVPLLFPPYTYNQVPYVDGGLTGNILLEEGIKKCTYITKDSSIDVIINTEIFQNERSPTKNIMTLVKRLIYIINMQLEYYPLFFLNKNETQCQDNNYIPVNIYIPTVSFNVTFTDFNNGGYLFDLGYNKNNTQIHKYYLCQNEYDTKINYIPLSFKNYTTTI